MSAFANNPWVKRDKAKKEDEIPRPKKNPRKPGKLTGKNPFGQKEETSEKPKPKPVSKKK